MRFAKLLVITYIGVFYLLVTGCSTAPIESGEQASLIESGSASVKPASSAAANVNPSAQKSFNQALASIKKGDNTQATRLLNALSKDYPELSGPATNLGLIYFREGDLARSESAFQQALSRNPKNAVALQHMGIIYRHQGKFEAAEKSYLAAIASQPDYANAHLNLAILYDIYLIKLNDALRHYEKYQTLLTTEDDTVKKWIIGLKRRNKVSK